MEKAKLKKSDLVSLYNGLNGVGNLMGVIFCYSINRNIEKIKPEIEALQKAITPSKEFMEYDTKRVDIVKKYALKDDKGEFIVKNNQYDVDGNEQVVEDEVKVLKEQSKDIIEAHDKQITEYNELLQQESDFIPYTVKLENVPKDITAAQMKLIFPIVEE